MFTISLNAQSATRRGADASDLDVSKLMQPIPASAAFHDPGYFVWCGTMVQSPDRKYHLYYSRWKIADGFQAWVTSSEIAHAIGDSPTGPFKFHDVTLPARGKEHWDASSRTIQRSSNLGRSTTSTTRKTPETAS